MGFIAAFGLVWNIALTVGLVGDGLDFNFRRKIKDFSGDVLDGPFLKNIAIPTTLFVSALVLYLKYGIKGCNLNAGEDNEWSFGQSLAVVLLFAPGLSALEVYMSMLTIDPEKLEC